MPNFGFWSHPDTEEYLPKCLLINKEKPMNSVRPQMAAKCGAIFLKFSAPFFWRALGEPTDGDFGAKTPPQFSLQRPQPNQLMETQRKESFAHQLPSLSST